MYLAHHAIEVAAELVDTRLIACRDEDTWRVSLRNPALFEVVERQVLLRCGSEIILLLGSVCISINLVEYQEAVERTGYKYVICRSLDEFREAVTSYIPPPGGRCW